MPDVLQVGFLMIRLDWLLVGISGVAGYFAMKHKFKKPILQNVRFWINYLTP